MSPRLHAVQAVAAEANTSTRRRSGGTHVCCTLEPAGMESNAAESSPTTSNSSGQAASTSLTPVAALGGKEERQKSRRGRRSRERLGNREARQVGDGGIAAHRTASSGSSRQPAAHSVLPAL